MADINTSMAKYFPDITYEQYLLYKTLNIGEDKKLIINDIYNDEIQELKGIDLSTSRLAYIFRTITLDYLPITFGNGSSTQGLWTITLEHTRMFHDHPGVYQVLVMQYLEITSIMWAIQNQPDLINNVSKHDIIRTRKNLNVLCTWLGDYSNILNKKREYYIHMITRLRRLEVDLGFIQERLGYIINNYSYTE